MLLSAIRYPLSAIVIAYFLDLIIGDPQLSWHPVRIIGKIINSLEAKLNKGSEKLLSGAVLVILVIISTAFCVLGFLYLAKSIHLLLYYILLVLLVYFSLSIKSLAVEAGHVYKALKDKNLQKARESLSMIVGRDTDKLEEPEIIRATVETVAESIMDGIIAPLFYVFLGGPVLGWIYKAINTLDSMVGHKNERFIEFGKASAAIDGYMNLIPAKITSFLIIVSGWLCGKDGLNSIKSSVKYLFKGREYNGTITEAAMAGVLKIQLGGVNFYNSVPVLKPAIGAPVNSLNIDNIRQSIQIAYVSSFLFLVAGLLLKVSIHNL